jgi:hypothetical protein
LFFPILLIYFIGVGIVYLNNNLAAILANQKKKKFFLNFTTFIFPLLPYARYRKTLFCIERKIKVQLI